MTYGSVVSDSSFYLCFLSDIKRPNVLLSIITSPFFDFVIGPIILREVEKSDSFNRIATELKANIRVFDYFAYGEIVRPFFSIDEVEVGEHEVVVVSYILHSRGLLYRSILDDNQPRRFLERELPAILPSLTGTIGFVELCTVKHKLFSKSECIELLEQIRTSRFRISNRIVDEAIERIGAACPDNC